MAAATGFKLIFDIADGSRVATELSVEEVDELMRTGGYLNVPSDVAEARRQRSRRACRSSL